MKKKFFVSFANLCIGLLLLLITAGCQKSSGSSFVVSKNTEQPIDNQAFPLKKHGVTKMTQIFLVHFLPMAWSMYWINILMNHLG
jgi:hypothetical protein